MNLIRSLIVLPAHRDNKTVPLFVRQREQARFGAVFCFPLEGKPILLLVLRFPLEGKLILLPVLRFPLGGKPILLPVLRFYQRRKP